MCAAQGCMYARLAWLAYALSAPNASSLFIYCAELRVRHSGTRVRLVGLACVRLTRYTHAAILFKCRAEPHVRRPGLHVRLVGLACVHYTHASTLSFALLSYMCAAHGLHIRFVGLAPDFFLVAFFLAITKPF